MCSMIPLSEFDIRVTPLADYEVRAPFSILYLSTLKSVFQKLMKQFECWVTEEGAHFEWIEVRSLFLEAPLGLLCTPF